MPSKPTLFLDFARSGFTSARINSARANTATYCNKFGILKTTSGNDIIRLHYDPTTLICKGLLSEPSRNNVVRSSEALGTSWTGTAANVSNNVMFAPDGNLTGEKLFEDNSAATTHFLSQTTTGASSNAIQSMSIWVKAGERGNVALRMTSGAVANRIDGFFNLSNGTFTISPQGNGVANFLGCFMEAWANGWYRISVSGIANSGTTIGSTLFRVHLAASANLAGITYTGDGSSGLYLWGAKWSMDGSPTLYDPIVATAAFAGNTNVNDVYTITPISDWIQNGQGTLFWQGEFYGFATGDRVLALSDNSTNNKIVFYMDPNTSNTLNAIVTTGGTDQAIITLATNLNRRQKYRVALSWANNSVIGCVDGVLSASNTTATIPTTLDRMGIGTPVGTGGQNGNLVTGKIVYFPINLPNDELQIMTSV
jgi:hypothetical protein